MSGSMSSVKISFYTQFGLGICYFCSI